MKDNFRKDACCKIECRDIRQFLREIGYQTRFSTRGLEDPFSYPGANGSHKKEKRSPTSILRSHAR